MPTPCGPSAEPGGAESTTAMNKELPASWQVVLAEEMRKSYFRKLEHFVDKERARHTVYPPEGEVFQAFKLTPYDKVKVLLLGQDPYHGPDQAHGLCFSVQPGVRLPPSLRNIFTELRDDLGCRIANNGHLVPWAEQGVLLLNAVLTVRAGHAGSHANKGWETFTDAVIRTLNERADRVVFVLWGGYAQKKQRLIDSDKNPVITAAHPSPLSATKFFGSKPFSAVNEALEKLGKAPTDWQIPHM
jgi:uracil-DNA glycosylase